MNGPDYYESLRYILKVRDVIINGPYILRQVEILLWTVEIFTMRGRDFHDNSSRFLWWHFEIYMMTERGFHDGKSRFYCQKVEVFMVTGQEFIMNGRDFHDGV